MPYFASNNIDTLRKTVEQLKDKENVLVVFSHDGIRFYHPYCQPGMEVAFVSNLEFREWHQKIPDAIRLVHENTKTPSYDLPRDRVLVNTHTLLRYLTVPHPYNRTCEFSGYIYDGALYIVMEHGSQSNMTILRNTTFLE